MVTWEIQDSVLVLTTAGFGGLETLFALSEAVSHPAFRPDLALLCDLRLETDDPSSEEMLWRAKFVAGLGISRRCALVIGLHQYGIARMQAVHLEFEGMEPEVFRDMDEAREWLAVVPPAASQPHARTEKPESVRAAAGRNAIRPTGTD